MNTKQEALSFEQRVIVAVQGINNGAPLKDFLDDEEIEHAIEVLADIYTLDGVRIPGDKP